MDTYSELLQKIQSKKAVVGIIGMGFVGKAFAEVISAAGFSVIGFERSEEKVEKLHTMKLKNFSATTDKSRIAECDIVLLCVQTPVDANKVPDLQYLQQASNDVARWLRRGQLIMTESSIAPGTTRNSVLPILETRGLQIEKEYFLGTSPERVDPGNTEYSIHEIPKLVAGFGEKSKSAAMAFYTRIIEKVIPVSNLETAEFTKMFENTFRLINISFVMEMRDYTNAIGVDIYEVIRAAASKPFGFLAHYPAGGIGGHCIPVDPYYLVADAKKHNVPLNMVEQAGNINDRHAFKIVKRAYSILNRISMNKHIADNAAEELFPSQFAYAVSDMPEHSADIRFAVKGGKSSRKSNKNIVLIGVTYKPDVIDTRESPADKVWEILEETGYTVSYHDPYVPEFHNTSSFELENGMIDNQDLIIIMTPHRVINYDALLEYAKPVLDTGHVYPWNTYTHVYHL
jgi:UDP-N-acetyl-D-glucosamine dehydrogenase